MKLYIFIKVQHTGDTDLGQADSQSLLQNRLMDVYKTWQGWMSHGPAHAFRLFGQICPEVDPRRPLDQWGAPFPKDFFFISDCNSNKPNASSYPELKFCDRLLFGLIPNLTVMLSDLLRNLTFNRSAQVSDQCPLGLLFIHLLSCSNRSPKEACLWHL